MRLTTYVRYRLYYMGGLDKPKCYLSATTECAKPLPACARLCTY